MVVNVKWVFDTMDALASFTGWRASGWSLFAAERSFYSLLESGSRDDLRAASRSLERHLRLKAPVAVDFSLTIAMDPSAFGDYQSRGVGAGRIRIPVDLIGHPAQIGAALAHELAHEFMHVNCVDVGTREEVEYVTDLMTVCTGLGQVMLNGIATKAAATDGTLVGLGYVPAPLMAAAYARIVRERHMDGAMALGGLCAEARRLVEAGLP